MIVFDALLRAARKLTDTYEGLTTSDGNVGGTTMYDTNNLEPTDRWNGGILFFIGTPRANTHALISDWDKATKMFTIPSGTQITSGTAYLCTTARWLWSDLLSALNVVLTSLSVTFENEATSVIADTTEYDLPSGVSRVHRVEYGSTADGWKDAPFWKEQNGHLRFYAQEPTDTSHKIRVHYLAPHAAMTADSGTISPQVNSEYLTEAILAELFYRRYRQVGDTDPKIKELYQLYRVRAQALKWNAARNPVVRGSGF